MAREGPPSLAMDLWEKNFFRKNATILRLFRSIRKTEPFGHPPAGGMAFFTPKSPFPL